MTLFDFEKYITKRNLRHFSFWSDNQPGYIGDVCCPCKVALSFDSIVISAGIGCNIITLRQGSNTLDVSKKQTLFFDRVLSVEVDETKAKGVLTVVTVICGDRKNSADIHEYVLVAS